MSSLSQESGAPRVPARPQVVQEVDEAALTRATRRCWSLLFLKRLARIAPLLPPVEGREENILFRFVSVPPLVQGPAVPTFSKKDQFPFPLGSQVHGTTVCDALPPHSRPRPILPVAKRVRFGDDIPSHAPLASPVRDPGSSVRMPQNCTAFCAIHPYSLSLHHHRYVDCAVGAACTASGGMAHSCPACLAGSRAQFDSATAIQFARTTSQVQRRSRDVGGSPERPCLARGDCCPPGKGCNQAGPSSRDEAGVLQPLLHRTQERWWPSANPGSASLEPGFTQAPVQDADAQAHDQMHSAPGLVCSDRPEGRLLSRFDPSATQTVSTVCIRRLGMAVQGPPLRALPVSPCVHEGCRGRPYPVTGSGRQDPQLPRRLAYSSPIQRAVGRSQGLGAPAPQPVGASGQLGKEQALPCAENLFSRCGVRLGEYDGTASRRNVPKQC